MSSPPWYMHLPYGISLSLQMFMRNKISPPKDVHKSHIEMTKYSGILSRVYSPLFVRNRQRVKKKRGQEMKVRTMLMMYEGCEMNEKMKLKPKTM